MSKLLQHAGEVSHQMAIEKSTEEYLKYKDEQKQVQHEESLKELEEDIKKLEKF